MTIETDQKRWGRPGRSEGENEVLKIQHSSDKYVWLFFRKRHTSGVLAWHLVKKRQTKRWERRRCDDLV